MKITEKQKVVRGGVVCFSQVRSPQPIRVPRNVRPKQSKRGGRRKSFGWVGYPPPYTEWLQMGLLLDHSNAATSVLQCAHVLKWMRFTARPH